MKTYLINQNGETVLKQIKSKTLKNPTTLGQKLEARKKSIQQSHLPKVTVQNQNFVNTERKMDKNRILKEIKKTEDSILYGGNKIVKEKKAEEKQRYFFNKICSIVNVHGQPHGKSIPFDTLNNPHVIQELFSLQEKLREAFPSSKLTALQSTAIKKQSFPGVNIVRQIFKEMGYKLKPINISEGYLGSKKLLRREYIIKKI